MKTLKEQDLNLLTRKLSLNPDKFIRMRSDIDRIHQNENIYEKSSLECVNEIQQLVETKEGKKLQINLKIQSYEDQNFLILSVEEYKNVYEDNY